MHFLLLLTALRSGNVILSLGAVDDESQVFLNGKLVHVVDQKTNPDDYWQAPRDILLKKELLRPDGLQTIVVRCNDIRGNGGMVGRPILRIANQKCYYADTAVAGDDPYRFYHW